jgi:hypothetical protein
MQFYGEDYCEIEGIFNGFEGSFVKILFPCIRETIFVPKAFIQNDFQKSFEQSQKFMLPSSFLKRLRIIPLKV